MTASDCAAAVPAPCANPAAAASSAMATPSRNPVILGPPARLCGGRTAASTPAANANRDRRRRERRAKPGRDAPPSRDLIDYLAAPDCVNLMPAAGWPRAPPPAGRARPMVELDT